jgi:malate synthase
MSKDITIRAGLKASYADVYTPEALSALSVLAPFNSDIKQLMTARIKRRTQRQQDKKRIDFLSADGLIPGTDIRVDDARAGRFEGGEIPAGLQRQWIQGTGPAAKPGAPLESSIRNVAYALLSGADGWMFDGEDALGQTNTMSLDNQRNLKLAIHKDPVFLRVAEQVAAEMNKWGRGFFGRDIIKDWESQLDFTTKIFRAHRGRDLVCRQ